jgi:hypothetical protein
MVDDVMAITGSPPASWPPAMAVVPDPDGSSLCGGPHRSPRADVEQLAVALEDMADDAAITRDALQRLDGDWTPVEQLRTADADQQCAEVSHNMHGVPVDVAGLVEAGSPGPDQRHVSVGTPLPCG